MTRIALRQLEDLRLITFDPDHGKPFELMSAPSPRTSLFELTESPGTTSSPTDYLRFLRSAVSAAGQLRFRKLRIIATRVLERKSRHGSECIPDLDRCAEHVRSFRSLRPLYPRKYLCLFDSLALVEFLARFHIFPDWVFGVQLAPFAAHCWVQIGDIVLNDSVENVRHYAPIMTV